MKKILGPKINDEKLINNNFKNKYRYTCDKELPSKKKYNY